MVKISADVTDMHDLVDGFDWDATPLGARARWPQSLRTAVDMILGSGQAMQLAWGPRRTLIYNDAYAPMLGDRHPLALGLPFEDAWADVWPDVEPLVARVFGGETIRLSDLPLIMTRHGYPEETFWTFSYSPVKDEEGKIAGLLNVPIDTTARVRADRAEQALRANERRLTDVLDGMSQSFGLMDRDFHILTQNRAALQLDGRSLSEIQGRKHWDVYPGSEESALGTMFRRSLAENVSVSHEHQFSWPNGATSWLEVHASPVPEGLAVFWSDISVRKAAEEALRDSEERQSFLLQLGDALRPLGDASKIRATGCALLGRALNVARVYCVDYDAVNEIGVVADDYRAYDLPTLAGRYPFKPFRKTYERIAAGTWVMPDVTKDTQLGASEREIYIAQGVISWVNVPLLKDGGLETVLCVVDSRPRNWSEQEVRLIEETSERLWASILRNRAEQALRESELRFQQFGASSLAAIWIRDATTFDFEYMNEAVERVFGLAPAQLLADERALGALIVPEDRDDMSKRVLRIAGGETLINEYRIRQARTRAVRWIRSIGFPIRNAEGEVTRIGGIAEDVTETKLVREHTQLLLSELQHRVRNLMAVIRTIAIRTERSASTPQEYRDALVGRLTALSRVQTLLTRSGSQGGSLREVIETEIRAKAEDDSSVQLTGPDIMLSAKAVEVLALAIHELCTNAVKYGALSVAGGRIIVDWRTVQREGRSWLTLDWVETGKAVPATPVRRGFGTELIEGRIPYELGGSGKLTFGPTGMRCHLEFPLRHRNSFLETDAPQPTLVEGGIADMVGAGALEGYTVLVVEDDFYIASDLVSSLQEAKTTVLGPCMTEEAALQALERTRPHAAVLDVNLGGQGPRFEIANRLRRLGIPFVFLTGYDRETIPANLRDAPHVEKPADFPQVFRLLSELLTKASG